jgi:hypothetical protein
MLYFGSKSQIFFKKCEWGIVYFKLKGRKKSLEGRMRPAGRTLAMSGLVHDGSVEIFDYGTYRPIKLQFPI